MSVEDRIRRAFRRNAEALSLRPSLGQRTATTRIRVREGLSCEIEDGDWRLVADMSAKSGGADTGPSPGVFGRAALGSCLAIGYTMWAAHRGVKIDGLEVEVDADFDSRGMYGVGDVEPGYTEIRYTVTVESDAPEQEVLRLLDEADARSPYLNVFREPQNLRREVHVLSTSTGD